MGCLVPNFRGVFGYWQILRLVLFENTSQLATLLNTPTIRLQVKTESQIQNMQSLGFIYTPEGGNVPHPSQTPSVRAHVESLQHQYYPVLH